MTQKVIAQAIFAAYPDQNEVYITADDQAFVHKYYADAHNATLPHGAAIAVFKSGETDGEAPVKKTQKPAPKQ